MDRNSSKANRTLGFYEEICIRALLILKTWPTRLWSDPYLIIVLQCGIPTRTLINQLEAIQNRAARFVTGDYRRKSNVSAMKKELNWEELALRRKVNCLTTLHQAVAGHLAIPVQILLRLVERNLRHSSPAARSFIPLSTNKNCFKYAFTPRTIIDWNSLPESVTSIEDKASFKVTVNKYILQ